MIVTVALSSALADGISPATEEVVAAELAEAFDELGIGGRAAVAVQSADDDAASAPITMSIDEQACRFPETLPWEALAYVDGTAVVPTSHEAFLERLGGPKPAGPHRLADVVAYVCRAAVIRQPELAAGDAPLAARTLADMWMGASADAAAPNGAGTVEELIAAAASPTIDVLAEPGYLASVTASEPNGELFPFLRNGIFDELGLPLPPLRFQPDPSLNPGAFALRINAVRTAPRTGLPLGSLLVNDTYERLALLDIEAQPTLNPASRQPGAIVTGEPAEALESFGLTTWDPLQFVTLAIAGEIRRSAHALLTRDVANALLEALAVWFPALAAQARRRVPTDLLTSVLRELLRDQVPIRNPRRILELLLRQATLEGPADAAAAVAYVRSGLADVIGARVAGGTETVVAYMLDPQLDDVVAELAAAPGRDDQAAERVVAAVRNERALLPPTAWVPALLTQPQLASPLRALLRPPFPDMNVIAYSDLPPNLNVQPVARLSPS